VTKPKRLTTRLANLDAHLDGLRKVASLCERLFVLDDAEALQQVTVARAAEILRCTSAMVCLLGPDHRHVTRGPSIGRAKDLRLAELFAAPPVVQAVFDEGRTLVLEDPEAVIGPAMKGWPAIAMAPMRGTERIIGTIFVGERLDGDLFTELDQALLGLIGGMAGGILEVRQTFTGFRDTMSRQVTEATAELARFATELQKIKTFDQDLFQSAPVGFVLFDRGFRTTFRNEAGERLWPDDLSLLAGMRRTDVASRDPHWESGLADVVNMQMRWKAMSVSFARPGGDPVRLNLTASPLRAGGREVVGGVLIVEDVTRQTQMERQLEVAERLAAIGRLASNAAHELNNPLGSIITWVGMGRRRAGEAGDERMKEYLASADKGLWWMATIIRDLLDYSHAPSRPTEPMAIRDILTEAAASVAPAAESSHVRVQVVCSPDLPTFKSGTLHQVVLNLVKNAVEAMPGGGEVEVRADCRSGALVIEVADAGTGIPEADLARIFEPFFTTKPEGQGTGLGLAISKDFVERLGGTIVAANRAGGGALFTVCVPIVPQ
jgi:two-component system sensor histidine kinase AtoS